MTSPWIRTTEIPEYYRIGKTKAFDLLREFKAQTDSDNWIKDGRVVIVRQEEFEKWWRSRK